MHDATWQSLLETLYALIDPQHGKLVRWLAMCDQAEGADPSKVGALRSAWRGMLDTMAAVQNPPHISELEQALDRVVEVLAASVAVWGWLDDRHPDVPESPMECSHAVLGEVVLTLNALLSWAEEQEHQEPRAHAGADIAAWPPIRTVCTREPCLPTADLAVPGHALRPDPQEVLVDLDARMRSCDEAARRGPRPQTALGQLLADAERAAATGDVPAALAAALTEEVRTVLGAVHTLGSAVWEQQRAALGHAEGLLQAQDAQLRSQADEVRQARRRRVMLWRLVARVQSSAPAGLGGSAACARDPDPFVSSDDVDPFREDGL